MSILQMPLPTLRDDYFYVQPSADILLTRYWSFGGYYLRRQNSGSISTVDFSSNEAGVRTTIKFWRSGREILDRIQAAFSLEL